MMISEPAGKNAAPPSPSPGESSLSKSSIQDTASFFWSTVNSPESGLPPKPSVRVFDWWELTKLNPRVVKSPTWIVLRPPISVVLLVRLIPSRLVWSPPDSLNREYRNVSMYLSVARSNWTPSKSGLENVIGVRVVRRPLPMVRA